MSKNERRSALITSILASSMAFIDSSALNVALPEIQSQLNLTGVQLLWIVNGYLLFLASLILAGGAFGDVFGKKRVFMIGIALFVISSLGCGLSPDGNFLIALRCVQGIGAALMIPGSLALISAVFPRDKRGKAIGYWSMFSSITTVIGPLIGGYLADLGFWRGVFFVNIPIGLIAMYILWQNVEEPEIRKANARPDWKGAAYSTLGFTGIVFAFLQGGEKGFGHWYLWASMAAGAIFLGLFIRNERRAEFPMLRLQLFQNRTFTWANILTFMVYGALGAFMFFLPLNLIQLQGYSPTQAGYAVLPFGIVIALMSPLAGKWTDRSGPKIPLILGPLFTGLAFIGMTFLENTGGWSEFATTYLPFLLLAGLGMGLTAVPVTTTVMSCVGEEQTGSASGINNTMSRLSGVIFLSLMGMVALLYFEDYVESRLNLSALPGEVKTEVESQIERFGDASAAAIEDENLRQEVSFVFDTGFFNSFSIVNYISAALCFAGALMAIFFIPGKKPEEIKRDSKRR